MFIGMKNKVLLEFEHIRRHVDSSPLQSPVGEHHRLLETRVLDNNVVALGVNSLYRDRTLACSMNRFLLYESCLSEKMSF
jgi:hypothetical protein